MTNRERAKAWMMERCPAEATGTRFGTDDVESGDTNTETGKPCDCLDALTKLLDEVRVDALRPFEFTGLRGTCPRCTGEDPDRYVDARPHSDTCPFAALSPPEIEACTHGRSDPSACVDCTDAIVLADPIARSAYWQNRAERYQAVIEEASNVLFDSSAGDVEHYIECHADTLPVVFRSVAAGHAAALGSLHVVIHERIEDKVVADPAPPLRPRED